MSPQHPDTMGSSNPETLQPDNRLTRVEVTTVGALLDDPELLTKWVAERITCLTRDTQIRITRECITMMRYITRIEVIGPQESLDA